MMSVSLTALHWCAATSDRETHYKERIVVKNHHIDCSALEVAFGLLSSSGCTVAQQLALLQYTLHENNNYIIKLNF